MAFMSHGHAPGNGQYGPRLARAADFVLACQKENGLLAKVGHRWPRNFSRIGQPSRHMHGLRPRNFFAAIERTLWHERVRNGPSGWKGASKKHSPLRCKMQRWPKDKESDKGGWRYIDDRDESDSDLSLTGWNLMFLRSARNAGFDVPKEAIDDAVAYVRRCYSKKYGTFEYWIDRMDGRTRGMAGAGILALAHAGYHNSTEAQNTGAWILKQKFDPYNRSLQNPATKRRRSLSLFAIQLLPGHVSARWQILAGLFSARRPVLLAKSTARRFLAGR